MLDDVNGKICLRFEEAEAQIDSLQHECSQQAEEINSLKARVQVLEDFQKRGKRRKRFLNLIVQGVEAQPKLCVFLLCQRTLLNDTDSMPGRGPSYLTIPNQK